MNKSIDKFTVNQNGSTPSTTKSKNQKGNPKPKANPIPDLPELGDKKCPIHPGGDHTTEECLLGGGKPIIEETGVLGMFHISPAILLCSFCLGCTKLIRHSNANIPLFASETNERQVQLLF
ncbi:hypothetical protein PHYBLDRAFT_65324 [Phycomyces blakesleeanus NRRL 1555(-)]|uniref:Uncharacterized protein n=1 Tax=Phycomyces blakesleeanus (strain ATCC 8743b / DSM 1359 / FGSC 10004 / NBRC 33097 / NRRL 1555) TaxID=763407 RepID=A0A163ADL5_PHYB8|nr:hypothetical protein PHYBLDRAFT_65324 [Phycomyces blakesleeanus NRRL 1555(-)]OAD72751.1 hypothetical protein PHYBLDRAFT_65324 [Phycomyces blakesleeanus NRRL 1555(-)]|eukprot:XP_018290791.1 hypothetical protein PHYBLDRAFT_65324 [Phycomyces blakesleeanus NRRL 1555(-)]